MSDKKKMGVKPEKKGEKKITFKEGGEHASTGTPNGEKIPAKVEAKARSGKMGVKAEKQEIFRENLLTGPKKKRGTSDGHMVG